MHLGKKMVNISLNISFIQMFFVENIEVSLNNTNIWIQEMLMSIKFSQLLRAIWTIFFLSSKRIYDQIKYNDFAANKVLHKN